MKRLITGALLAAGLMWAFGAGEPQAQSASAKLNVAVICVKCIPDDMPQEAYNAGTVLLDQNTGDLWFYPALSRGVKPRKLGTFTQLGAPLVAPAGER